MKIIKHAKNEMKIGLRPSTRSDKKKFSKYFEFHHILPKCLYPLWRNTKINIVALTAREHYFCHQLLVKIYPTQKMIYSLHTFISRPRLGVKVTSKEYERIKSQFRKTVSERMKTSKTNIGNLMRGKPAWNKGLKSGIDYEYKLPDNFETWIKGKTWEQALGKDRADYIKNKISNTLKNKGPYSDERKANMSLGKKLAKERKPKTYKIFCKELNLLFTTFNDTERYFKDFKSIEIKAARISDCCKREKSLKGFSFFLIEEIRNINHKECYIDAGGFNVRIKKTTMEFK